ncbi:uncharacterized protein LOC142352087 [Convolutriloba macropyga]|uniref:uncharacterized protein LOC142352087 n=1 Tax=Convolutriloba macropyga TaxID=536237 RepID=UPI003F522876
MKLADLADVSVESNSDSLNSSEQDKDFIRSCLNKQFAVTITDGRVMVGDFLCTDKDANIILGGTQEYVPGRPEEESRQVGLVIVPGKHIKKIMKRN